MSAIAFTLLVRLPDESPPPTHPWRPWYATAGSIRGGGSATSAAPGAFKTYPGFREYFAPQVERVLFPRLTDVNGSGGRWIRQPVALSLELGRPGAEAVVLNVDLLEVVRVALRPGVSFGLVHLSAPGLTAPEQMLGASELLATRFRRRPDDPSFVLVGPSGRQLLSGTEPVRALTTALFGGAHANVMHRCHRFVAARLPDEVAPGQDAIWGRALGRGYSLAAAMEALGAAPSRDDQRTEPLGRATALFFGLSTVVTHRENSESWLYNVRSYWSEAVLFALIQQSYLETYAEALGHMGGEPFAASVEDLFTRWLAFRNVLWWSELSYTTDVPGKILSQIHSQLNTARLFAELEHAFSRYVDARRHRTSDSEREALRSLQVYGAAFASVSAAAAVIQVAGVNFLDTTGLRLIVVGGLAVLGLISAAITAAVLNRGDRARPES